MKWSWSLLLWWLLLWSLAAVPASADWPAWVERWLFNPAERTERAVESFEKGTPAAALGPSETALRLEDSNPVTQYNAGTARLAAKSGDAASLLESAAAGAGLLPQAHYNLGNARLEGSDFPGAIEAFKEALRREPGMEDAKFNLELARRLLEQQQQDQQDQEGQDGDPQQQDPQQQDPQQDQEQDPQDQDQDQEQDQEQDPQDQDQQQDQEQDPQDQDQQQEQQQQEQQQESPLPQFEDLPDMTAEEAAAILEAIENMEREQRRQQALEVAKATGGRKKDW